MTRGDDGVLDWEEIREGHMVGIWVLGGGKGNRDPMDTCDCEETG